MRGPIPMAPSVATKVDRFVLSLMGKSNPTTMPVLGPSSALLVTSNGRSHDVSSPWFVKTP